LQNEDNTRSHSRLSAEIKSTGLARVIVQPLYDSLLWIRLFAACLIFYGGLITVTGVGILVAWIPMWIGILLLLATKSIKHAYEEESTQALLLSLTRLKTIFTILGLTSAMLITGSIYLVVYAIDNSLF